MKATEILQLVKEIASHEYDSKQRPSNNYRALKEMAQKIVIDNIEDDYFMNKDEDYLWLFNWQGGGFNDVWAKTKEEAIAIVKVEREEAKIEYPTHRELIANEDSFRKATRRSSREQDRAGYMMTI